jgi:hypothetical protein
MTERICGTGGWTGPLPGDPDNNVILSATSVFGGIRVSWTYPTLNPHAVAHVLLYRGTSPDFNLSGTPRVVNGNVFYDQIDEEDQNTYFYWMQIISINGTPGDVVGPASATKVAVSTQLLGLLNGQLTESALNLSLQSKIDNIALNELAIADEIQARAGDSSLISAAIDTLETSVAASNALILGETVQRQTALLAEATSRNLLAAQMRGTYEGSDLSFLTSGLLYQERQVRSSADGVLTTSISVLSAAVEDPTTGLSAAHSAITDEATARATADSAIASTVTTLESVVASKNKTYSQITAPTTGMVTGDLWFDTDDSNKAYRYSGTAWVVTDDTRIANNAAAITSEATARATADSALASDITTLSTTVNGHTTSIQTNATSINGLEAQYTVKIDNNGYVTGYGLASTVVNGTPTSEFAVVADKFSIAPVATDAGAADGSPFFHLTVPTSIGGVTVPAGTYMKAAFIHDASITNAKIGNVIQSADYSAGTAGWKIDKAGNMELNAAVFRGTIDVKSATTNARLEIKNNVIKVYDSAGNLRVKLGDLTA